MPFIRNVVEPGCVQQGLPPKKGNEKKATLQDFTNLALVNIIRQLASLQSKVDIIFGHLVTESAELNNRLKQVKIKLTNIEENMQGMNSNKEIIGKALGKDKKAVYKRIADRSNYFQSEQQLESGLFMEESMPREVKLLYEQAEPMPRLKDLDNYRTDGKLCAKFYSNPNVFFLAWQDSLQKMIAQQHAKSTMKARGTVRQTNLRRVRKAKASRIIEAQKVKMGVELAMSDSTLADEDEEYFSEDEWSDSEDDDILLSPASAAFHLQRNGKISHNSSLAVKSNHYRLSSFGEYNIEDIEHTTMAIEMHSPPVSIIGEDFSLLPMNKYGEETGEHEFNFSLESTTITKWEDNTEKT